jgi:hypothetical protein
MRNDLMTAAGFLFILMAGCSKTVPLKSVLPHIKEQQQFWVLKGSIEKPADIKSRYIDFLIIRKNAEDNTPCYISSEGKYDGSNEGRIQVEFKEITCSGGNEKIQGYAVAEDFSKKGIGFDCNQNKDCFDYYEIYNLIVEGDSELLRRIIASDRG